MIMEEKTDIPPTIEEVLGSDTVLERIRRSGWWKRLTKVLVLLMPVTLSMIKDYREHTQRKNFESAFEAIKPGDSYRADFFDFRAIELPTASATYDKVTVWYEREKFAVIGVKNQKIKCCYVAALIREEQWLRVDNVILAAGYKRPYDASKWQELAPPTNDLVAELFRVVHENDATVKQRMPRNSRKDYILLRGEMYVYIVTHMKRDIGIQIRSQE